MTHGPFPEGPRAGGRPIPPDALRNAGRLRDALGSNLAAIVFFGSRYLGTSPNATSACDLFVVVEDYDRFYEARMEGVAWGHRPRTLARLNRILPPNILSFHGDAAAGPGSGAKLFLTSTRDFARALARRSPDHFVKGRLTQDVVVLDARDDGARRAAQDALDGARRSALDWVPAFLSTAKEARAFTVEEFCLRMIEVSYAHEIRPEPAARVREVFEAQRAFFAAVYGAILDDAVRGGRLVREDAGYRLARPPGWAESLRWRAYFKRSKTRATLRWLKYTATYDDWLDYLVRKVERRTGLAVEITPLERRLPFLLLWPKVFRVLRERKAPGASAAPRPDDRSGRRG